MVGFLSNKNFYKFKIFHSKSTNLQLYKIVQNQNRKFTSNTDLKKQDFLIEEKTSDR